MKAIVFTLAGFLLPSFGLLANPAATSNAKVVDLRVERMANPDTVNHPLPRFGWRIETEERGYLQISYRILAASSAELLSQDKGDLWDSDEGLGRQSQFIAYGGHPLTNGQVVFWKVKSKNHTGKFTPWSKPARFTVKLSGPPELPTPLFLPVSDAPRLSSFECSIASLNNIFGLAAEQLHDITSVRDIGLAMRAASYHQEIHPRAAAWLHHMKNNVDAAGFYPTTLPSNGTYGSSRSDAGVTATHSLWWMTGDQTLLHQHLDTLRTYVISRNQRDRTGAGVEFGELPQDTLPPTDSTPVGFVHSTGHAINLRLMLEIARFASRYPYELQGFQQFYDNLRPSFAAAHLRKDGSLKYDSITAHLMALRSGLFSSDAQKKKTAAQLIALTNSRSGGDPLTQSPFATQNLLPVLTFSGHHDLALEIARSNDGATLPPLALLGISEWLVSMVAGIQTEDAGFRSIVIAPTVPSGDQPTYAKSDYQTPYGTVSSHWRRSGNKLLVDVSIPPNATALIRLPAKKNQPITLDSKEIQSCKEVIDLQRTEATTSFRLLSGTYQFQVGQ